jgi:pimeloyl-ACP methyl ester carboxylesterase
MTISQGWVHNGEIRLHFYDSDRHGLDRGVPLLIVPGTAEAAEDYLDLLEMLQPRRVLVLSLRGRGRSSSPQSGYGFWEQVSDVQALIEALDLRRFALYGFSRGVTLAIGAAAHCGERVAGLIVGDYPAHYKAYSPAWVEKFLAASTRGVPVSEKLMRHVVLGIQRESDDVSLWDLLPRITCPVLILRGGAKGSLLPVEAVQMYMERLPDARVIRFEDSGHALWEPDYGRFVLTLAQFLTRLDNRDAGGGR